MEEKQLTFEEAISRLNEITNRIQRSDTTLDEGFALFEEGVKLAGYCSEKLEEYNRKLNEITGKLEEGNEQKL
ncbi:MAG: exodeoxyribonuclease VII small subunit [Erysipelotrichaceae bacterium]|nr:exodeoxyribonuclease VII small subunit [Erysipelotrichaceae bacterium]